MMMRVNQITTHLRLEDAYTIVEFLDQLRAMLMQTYGDKIVALLQEASQPGPTLREWRAQDEPF